MMVVQRAHGGRGRFRFSGLILAFGLLVSGCAETQFLISSTKRLQRGQTPDGIYKIGNPYQIQGVWYYPAEDWDYDETGIASWYGPGFHGKNTANGETYDQNELTAAHRTLPMPSFVQVVNLDNGRSIVLRVNDRGPFAKGRIIDVSRRGAQLLGFEEKGTARVRVQILAERSLAVKQALQGGDQIAREGSPINVPKLPKATVSAESLPPPPGGTEAAGKGTSPAKPAPVQAAETAPVGNSVVETDVLPTQEVTQVAVAPTNIYVQAGAFTNYQNAQRTQISLNRVSPTTISHVVVNNRDFYRVRVGPLPSVDAADRALEQVQGLGYSGAKIIVAPEGSGS